MKKEWTLGFAILALAMAMPAVATARGPLERACQDELETYCSSAAHGEEMSCLLEVSDLSSECSEEIAKMSEMHLKIETQCAEDIASYCSEDQGRDLMHCLTEQADKLSSSCQEALPPAPPRRGEGGPHE